MTKLLILRSGTRGNRPAGKSYGEPYVNFAENQFGVINSAGGAQDLLGIPIYSASATYTVGAPVNNGGNLYVCTTAITTPEAFNSAHWSLVATQAWANSTFAPEAPNDGTQYARQSKTWTPIVSRLYWGGNITPTPLGINVTNSNNTTGVITFASAHGMPTGQCVVMSGGTPSGLSANTCQYFRSLSTTTGAFYNTLADAYADTNRIIPGSATGWSCKPLVYTGVDSKGFDPIAPIGAQGGAGNIKLELNLASALPQTNNVLAILERINSLFDNQATPAQHSSWISAANPTIVNNKLIGFYSTNSWVSWGGSPITVVNQGNWAAQANNPFYFGIIVIAQ